MTETKQTADQLDRLTDWAGTAEVHESSDGWLYVRLGELVVKLALSMGGATGGEQVEIRCNGTRVFVEGYSDGLIVGPVEKYS